MKKLILIVIIAGIFFAVPAQAQTNQELIASLQAQINELLKIVMQLQAQVLAMLEKQATLDTERIAEETRIKTRVELEEKEKFEQEKKIQEEKETIISEMGKREWFQYYIGQGGYDIFCWEQGRYCSGVSKRFLAKTGDELKDLRALYKIMLETEKERAMEECQRVSNIWYQGGCYPRDRYYLDSFGNLKAGTPSCGSGYYLDTSSNACLKIPSCPSGYYLDSSWSCLEIPSCPKGYSWDIYRKQCVVPGPCCA